MPILTFDVRPEQRPDQLVDNFTASFEWDLGDFDPEDRDRVTARLNSDGDVCSMDHDGRFFLAGEFHATPPNRQLGKSPRRVVAKSPTLAGLFAALEAEERMIESARLAREEAIRLLDAARQIAFPIPALAKT